MFKSFDIEELGPIVVEREGDEVLCNTEFAFCDQSNRILSVKSAIILTFDTLIHSGFFHEISFSIEVISLDGAYESFITQDRDISLQYIPPDFRSRIIEIVGWQYAALVEAANPIVIYRVTKAIPQNNKVVAKHDLLTTVLESLGYQVIDAGHNQYGRCFWLMERSRATNG